MTLEQITLVQDSFAKAAPVNDGAAEVFYARLPGHLSAPGGSMRPAMSKPTPSALTQARPKAVPTALLPN